MGKRLKTYVFTEEEVLTLRNAMLEYYQMVKNLKPNSPIAIRNIKNAKALKEQFSVDAGL